MKNQTDVVHLDFGRLDDLVDEWLQQREPGQTKWGRERRRAGRRDRRAALLAPDFLPAPPEMNHETETWVEVLWDAIQKQNRRQVLLACCPPKLLDLAACLQAGIPTGRGQKTEKNALREIRAAARASAPRQRPLFLVSYPTPTPRPPTKRGRPKGSKTRRTVEEQGVLV